MWVPHVPGRSSSTLGKALTGAVLCRALGDGDHFPDSGDLMLALLRNSSVFFCWQAGGETARHVSSLGCLAQCQLNQLPAGGRGTIARKWSWRGESKLGCGPDFEPSPLAKRLR